MDAKMHTVELLEQAIALAERCGFEVRQDWFGGSAAGACEFKGRRWIFIDLAISPREQLDQVLEALGEVPNLALVEMGSQLQKMLNLRKIA
jgi:hypothetical protein